MRSTTVLLAAAVLAGALALSACGGSSESHSAGAAQSAQQADHNAADVAFVRQIMPVNQQAVSMSQMVSERTKNQQVIDLAVRSAGDQFSQNRAFQAFQMQWPDAQGSTAAQNAPGLVDAATLAKLQSLTGAPFDRLWLTSMLHNHTGAVALAQEEVAHGKNPDVIYLARSIIATQQPEIDEMKKLLGG